MRASVLDCGSPLPLFHPMPSAPPMNRNMPQRRNYRPKPGLTRRTFLRHTALLTAATAAPSIIPSSALGAAGTVAPSNRINIGLIGRGIMGRGHLRVLLGRKDAQVLAVCDVDRTRCEEGRRIADETYAAERSSGTYRACVGYNDYRELLARSDIDAVVIVTPDHWHALISC